MSDSNHSPAIPDEAVSGVSTNADLEDSSKPQDLSEKAATVPVSSPPLLEDVDKESLPSEPPRLEPNGHGARSELDADNDSEAETLISSPVKKREALKANGRRAEHASDEPQDNKNGHESTTAKEEIKESADVAGEELEKNGESTIRIKRAEAEETGLNDEESDYLSDVASLHSGSADSAPRRPPRSARDDSESEKSEEDVGGRRTVKRNGNSTNPRKRKHRDSHINTSMEPPRRRRRASDDGDVTAEGENGDSPSPKPRRHRRTVSTQSSLTDPSRSVSGSNSVAGTASGRQRRAATHFPAGDVKATRNSWDSDTSSETSQKHHLSRLNRGTNRSVSTPGRPLARDHKRHVNKYGFTRLAEACENGDLDMVKEWRVKDPEQLEQREFAGNTPLQVASLNGFPEIVSYLLEEGCNPHTANTDQDTPLIDAVENGHIEVVHLLLKAGVNPLRQNLKGQQALDVVTEETENAQEIRSALREAIEEWRNNGKGPQQHKELDRIQRPGPSKELHFLAYTSSNLLRLAGENDQAGILELLKSSVQVTNEIVAAAAKTGDTFTVSMLLAELLPKEAKKKPELPLLAVVGTSHFEMVMYLTGADGFNPTWRSRSNGLTWYELAQERQGPNWQQEKALLKRLYDERTKSEKLSSSPVSRRENGKRRRSPLRQLDSDVEMEDPDSNDHARSRRRLVSKKVMREATHRRRSESLSNSDNGHAMSKNSSKATSPGAHGLVSSVPRKVGRPRKASVSNQVSEPRAKRTRSSSIRDAQPPFDSPQIGSFVGISEEPQHEKEQKIKIEESERQRAETEAIAKAEAEKAESEALAKAKAKAQAEAEAEAKRIAEAEAKAKEEKLAEERRKAEQIKKEEDEARRKEAERKAEEIRLQHQRRMAEERRLKVEKQIQTLPSALQHVLGLTIDAKLEKQKYIQRHFLPIQVVKRGDLLPAAEDGEKSDELWMLSYQAAAILTNADAATLLDLPTDPRAEQSAMAGVVTIETSQEQRRAILPCLQSSSLVHASPADEEEVPSDNLVAELAMAERARRRIAEDRCKFMAMKPLHWVRFSDFYNAATMSGSTDSLHLAGLEFPIRFDCCLDPTPFLTDVKSDGGKHCINGIRSNGTEEHDYATANGVKGKRDGVAVSHWAGPGITTLTVVQD